MNKTSGQRCPDFSGNDFQRIRDSLLKALHRVESSQPIPIFYRADDIGVMSRNFLRLLHLFQEYRVALSLAVVPAWITRARWSAVAEQIETGSSLWCWHQHGWTHANHEESGKKCEFGSARPADAIKNDLIRGRDRLEAIIGSSFSPIFTPPWNRCSDTTIDILQELGFLAISRSRGEQKHPVRLTDYFVNVDLHTRKETDAASALDNVCGELRQGVSERRIGIMIHHQLMDQNSFKLLELLLAATAGSKKLEAGSFITMR